MSISNGIKNWLSRYHPRYPRSLVYMLQASEYGLKDYLAWYQRTRDFVHVEQRKTLTLSLKALALLSGAWLLLICLYASAISLLWLISTPINYIAGLVLIIFTPHLLAYLIIIPTSLAQVLQWPLEYLILRQTSKRLREHKGLKIAIAGSYGKTSMREILKTVLSEGKRVVAPPHSYNTPLGISKFAKTLKGDEEIILLELGEYYPGDIRKLCELVHPSIGIVTGVNEAHLEKFKTLERTADTIFEIAEYVDAGHLYVNGENKIARGRAESKYLIYDSTGVSESRVTDAVSNLEGTSFNLTRGDTKLFLHSSLLGLHQVGPLALAAQIAAQVGLSPDQIQKGIAKTRPFEHRLVPSIDSSGVVTLDDSYNGNPDGVNAIIDFLASLNENRRFYVTPGLVEMGKSTESVHRAIGKKLAEAGIEKIVLIRDSVTPFIEQGLKENNYRGDILWFDNAPACFQALPHLTVKGDVVLLQNDWPDQYH